MSSRGAARRISRDTILFVSGLAGIAYQQVTGKVSIPLLVVFGLMVGLPGVAALLALLPLGNGEAAPTTSASPSPPSSSSPPSSPAT